MNRVGASGEAINAYQGRTGSTGLQAGPTARWHGGTTGELFAHQGQSKFDTGEFESYFVGFAPVEASEGVQVVRANAQDLRLHGAGI